MVSWSDVERRKLREMSIDSTRHSRDELSKLVTRFKSDKPGTIYSVTRKGVPVKKSQEFARKVSRLAQSGDLPRGTTPAPRLPNPLTIASRKKRSRRNTSRS